MNGCLCPCGAICLSLPRCSIRHSMAQDANFLASYIQPRNKVIKFSKACAGSANCPRKCWGADVEQIKTQTHTHAHLWILQPARCTSTNDKNSRKKKHQFTLHRGSFISLKKWKKWENIQFPCFWYRWIYIFMCKTHTHTLRHSSSSENFRRIKLILNAVKKGKTEIFV